MFIRVALLLVPPHPLSLFCLFSVFNNSAIRYVTRPRVTQLHTICSPNLSATRPWRVDRRTEVSLSSTMLFFTPCRRSFWMLADCGLYRIGSLSNLLPALWSLSLPTYVFDSCLGGSLDASFSSSRSSDFLLRSSPTISSHSAPESKKPHHKTKNESSNLIVWIIGFCI